MSRQTPESFAARWSEDRHSGRPPSPEALLAYRALAVHAADPGALLRAVEPALSEVPAIAVPVAHALAPDRLGELVVRALPSANLAKLAAALRDHALVPAAAPALLASARGGLRPALHLLDALGAVGPERWWYTREHTVLETAFGPARREGERHLGRLRLNGAVVLADPAGLQSAAPVPGLAAEGSFTARCLLAAIEGLGTRPAALVLERARVLRDTLRFEQVAGENGRAWVARVDTATIAACAERTARRLSAAQADALAADLAAIGEARLGGRASDTIVGCATGAGDGAFPTAIGRDPDGAVAALVLDLLPRRALEP